MPQKKGDLTPLVQYVIHSLLRFGRSFDDELFVIAKLLQPALNVCGGILKCLIIQDACMIANLWEKSVSGNGYRIYLGYLQLFDPLTDFHSYWPFTRFHTGVQQIRHSNCAFTDIYSAISSNDLSLMESPARWFGRF
jgi:hypothetical protein